MRTTSHALSAPSSSSSPSFIPSISSTSQPSRKRGRNGTSDEPAQSKRKLRASARDLPLPNHDSNDDEEGLADKDIIVKSYTSYLRNYHISSYRRLKQEFETISVLFNEMKAASGETNTRSASNAARTLVREVVKTFEKWLDYLDKTMRIISEDIQGHASQTAYSWDGYLVQKLVRRKWKAYEGLVEGFEATSFRGELPEPQIDKEDLVPLLNELPTMLRNIERHQWLLENIGRRYIHMFFARSPFRVGTWLATTINRNDLNWPGDVWPDDVWPARQSFEVPESISRPQYFAPSTGLAHAGILLRSDGFDREIVHPLLRCLALLPPESRHFLHDLASSQSKPSSLEIMSFVPVFFRPGCKIPLHLCPESARQSCHSSSTVS
jgi:hypothetical protein